MFVPTASHSVEARIVYGTVDETGHQDVNISIPGVGVLICDHNANDGYITDYGFDWHEETAYAFMFPELAGKVYDQEAEEETA